MGTSKGFEWSHSDTYEDVLHDAQQIFKIEANAGLGNFMQRKPKKVSDAEYEKLLKVAIMSKYSMKELKSIIRKLFRENII